MDQFGRAPAVPCPSDRIGFPPPALRSPMATTCSRATPPRTTNTRPTSPLRISRAGRRASRRLLLGDSTSAVANSPGRKASGLSPPPRQPLRGCRWSPPGDVPDAGLERPIGKTIDVESHVFPRRFARYPAAAPSATVATGRSAPASRSSWPTPPLICSPTATCFSATSPRKGPDRRVGQRL